MGYFANVYWQAYATLSDRASEWASDSILVKAVDFLSGAITNTLESMTQITPSEITETFRQLPNKLHNSYPQATMDNTTYASTDTWSFTTPDDILIIWSVFDEDSARVVTVSFGEKAKDCPRLDDEKATKDSYFLNHTYTEFKFDATQLGSTVLTSESNCRIDRYYESNRFNPSETEDNLSSNEWYYRLLQELPLSVQSELPKL